MSEGERKILWLPIPSRFARVIQRLFVGLALVFFSALVFVLWAFQTGRAAEVARERIVTELRAECNLDARFESFRFGMFPPEATMSKLVLTQPGGETFVAVEEAIVSVSVLPLLYGRVQLARVALLAPEAMIALAGGAVQNLPRCLAPKPTQEPSPTPSAPIALGVSALEIERGHIKVQVDDFLEADIADIGVTLKPGPRGGSELALAIDGGRLRIKDKELPLEHLRLLAQIAGRLVSPRALTIDRLDLLLAEVELRSKGSIDLIGPVYEAEVDLDAPLAVLKKVLDDLPEISGEVKLHARLTGTAAQPRAAGRLTLLNGRFGEYGSGDRAEIDFHADEKKIVIPSLSVRTGDGGVSGRLSLALTGRRKLKADLETDRISLGRVLDASGVKSAWVDFRGTGKITAAGQLSPPIRLGGRVEMDVRDFYTFDRGWDQLGSDPENDPRQVYLHLPEVRVTTAWSADADALTFKDALVTRHATTGTVTTRLGFATRDGIHLTANFAHFDFDDLGPIVRVPIAGKGRLSAVLKGPYTAVGGKGRVELSGTRVGDIPFGEVKSGIEWKDDTVLLFDDLEGKLASSKYRGKVRVDFEPRLVIATEGEVTDGRLEDLLIPFDALPETWGHPRGAMTGRFVLSGPLTELSGPIELEVRDPIVVEEKGEHGRVKGRLEAGALVFDELEVEKHGARIFASGRVDPKSGAITGRARTEGLSLAKLDVLASAAPKLDGDLAVTLEVSGTLRQVDGAIHATLARARAGELSIGGGRIDGKIKSSKIAVDGSLLDGALTAEGEVELRRGLPYKGMLRLDDYDLPQLVGSLGEHPSWTGTAVGRAELSGSLVEWRDSQGTLFLERALFDNGDALRLELVSPASLALDRGQLETKRLVLGGPETRLQVVGKLGSRLTDLRVQGRIELSILEHFFTPIERSAGVLTLNAVVRRQSGDLDLIGTGRVERGMVEWRGLPSRFSGITAGLTFSQSTILFERVEGRWAEGRVTASGQVLLEGTRPKAVAIEARLEEVRPQFSYAKFDLSGTTSGRLSIEGRPDHLVMRGELEVARSLFRPKFDWRAIVADPAQRASGNVYDPSKEVMHFDVGVHLDQEDPLRLRNDTAQVDLFGDVSMSGTNQRLGLLGSLTVGRGRVGFIGREYSVEGGTLEFRDKHRFDPRYDLFLSARACDADIKLNLLGTLDDVTTSYHSKPEMEETNIVSCLVRGVKIKDLESLRGDTRSTAAASFAGEALWRLSGVDQQVRKVIPLDQVEVTTEYSTRERVYEPRILVAKEIQDGKFRLEYSSSLVKNDDQRAAVRYRITPALTLQYGWASSDNVTIGDHGVDLKYRWEW